MLKRFVSYLLVLCMVLGMLPLAAMATSTEETTDAEDGLIAAYQFDAINEDGTVTDQVGTNNATVALGSAGNVPTIVDGALELNNTTTDEEGETKVLGGTTGNGITIPNEVFAGLEEVSVEMEIKLHSSQHAMALMTAGVDRNTGYVALINEFSGSAGLRTAATLTKSNRESVVASSYTDKAPLEQWATVTYTRDASGVARLYLNGKLTATGFAIVGLQDMVQKEGNIVSIGRSHVFDPDDPAVDGAIRSLKIYNKAIYATEQTARGPVAYYTFDNGDLKDESGLGNDASFNGVKTASLVDVEGRGKVVELNNKNVKRDNANGLQIPTKPLKGASGVTIMMDILVRNLDAHPPVFLDVSEGKGNVDPRHFLVGLLSYGSYGVNVSAQVLDLADGNEHRISSGVNYGKLGQWAQLAFVQEGTSTAIYLDGQMIAAGEQYYSVADFLQGHDDVTLTLGRPTFWPDGAIDGMIDNVRVYDYAVSAEQLANPVDPVELPLELYYDFEDVDGTTVKDQTGNGNDGTLLNNASTAADTQMGSQTLVLDNDGISGSGAAGLLLPSNVFENAGAFTVVMDVRMENANTNWTSLLTAGANSDQGRYMVVANQGFDNTRVDGVVIGSNQTVGLTAAGTIDGNRNQARIFAKSGTQLQGDKWGRVAFSQDAAGNSALFLDGKKVASGKLDTTIMELVKITGSQVRIGSNNIWPDPGIVGRIDNVRVYSAVLTENDLATLPWTVEEEPIGDVEFPELGAHGLIGDFYLLNSGDLSYGEYKGTYVDKDIAFEDMEDVIAVRAGASDYVAARWTGRIAAPETGDYTFYCYSDNGMRLYIDDELVIDWWVNQWDKEQHSSRIHLEKGEPHKIVFEWFEYNGGSHVTLKWKNNQNVSKCNIPASAYYLPEGTIIPTVTEIDTSKAQLDLDQENFGGSLILKGENLGKVKTVEVASSTGKSLSRPLFLDITEISDNEITVTLPDTMRANTYRLKLTEERLTVVTDTTFTTRSNVPDRSEHPRPDKTREDWINLNGWWDFAYDADEVGITEQWNVKGNKTFEERINVPYPWESEMSGITNTSYRGQVWYHRTMNLDESWVAEGKTTHLYFGAVDAKCIVYVNGTEVGSHDGGYTQFEFDITDFVHAGENDITLWVEDKASYGDNSYPALVGKQGHNAPCGYTHTSGIWQSVIVESRSETYINYAHANAQVAAAGSEQDAVQYDMSIQSASAQTVTLKYNFQSKLWNETLGKDEFTGSTLTAEQTVALTAGENTVSLDAIAIENAKLWSDTEANLYYGTIEIVAEDGTVLDTLNTYFGLRQIYTDYYNGRDYQYIYLNGKPIFMSGLLDQGFFSEGIYTASSEEALKFDILAMKERGFNMLRKHLKIEDPLQYYWCDKLGFFVWQDMPHATAMNATSAGGEAPGRVVYENALRAAMDRNYNYPSVVMMVLFNETWGINHNGPQASDGMTTHAWMEYLYNLCKEINPGLLVEDMSACNQDHIQPTDVNTFHMYPGSYSGAKSTVKSFADGSYVGSGKNFWGSYKNEGEPFLNSEYGGVGAFAGDWDVSLCFKYQTDIQRQVEKLNGYVYTEPYDIEYERNGILTYDRRTKLFPYGDVAYGGDMSIVDLNQANYVGIDAEPAKRMSAGAEYSADAVAANWSGDNFTGAILKWRFDATDRFGNNISTGISGEKEITYAPYTAERYNIRFNVPNETCVGTVTVWIEQDGVKIAKNFVNLIVTANDAQATETVGKDGVALRASTGLKEFAGSDSISYEYAIPENFDLNTLDGLRVIAEASSRKEATVNYGISNSAMSQTTEGSERPSDMTVSINGVEIDTVYLQDNPRDIRGTLTINQGNNGGSSSGNFGYLTNIRVPEGKLAEVAEAIRAEGKIIVTYSVKADAENRNGLRIYSNTTGRYAVNPTVILNPTDKLAKNGTATPKDGNYLATATLSDGGYIDLRGGILRVSLDGGMLALGDTFAEVGEGEHIVAVRVFDDHYQVYVDNNPEAVIDVYDYTAWAKTTVSSTASDLVVAPETYDDSVVEETLEIVNGLNGETIAELTADELEGLTITELASKLGCLTATVDGKTYAFAGWYIEAQPEGFDWTAKVATDEDIAVENTIYAYFIDAGYLNTTIAYTSNATKATKVYALSTVPGDIFGSYGILLSTAASADDSNLTVGGAPIEGLKIKDVNKTTVYQYISVAPFTTRATANAFNGNLGGANNGDGYLTYAAIANVPLKTVSARAYYVTQDGTVVYGTTAQTTLEANNSVTGLN